MGEKPTYEELVQIIKALEVIAADYDETKEALEESESRYRLLAENVNDVITVMDENLAIKYISPSVKKLSGYTPEEVKNQVLEEQITAELKDRLY